MQTFFGGGAAPLTFKICRRNEYKLLMGPFGSDQSRHVDDFGAKKRNFDDSVAKKLSFGGLSAKQMKNLKVFCANKSAEASGL